MNERLPLVQFAFIHGGLSWRASEGMVSCDSLKTQYVRGEYEYVANKSRTQNCANSGV